MAIYNPLSWQSENAVAGYPFSKAPEIADFIVDAKFIQFDGFIPSLNYVQVDTAKITLSMTFDYGTNDSLVYFKTAYTAGVQYKNLEIYNENADRYLGSITFGAGLEDMWLNSRGRKIAFSNSFSPNTVISIPSNDAVYTFDSNYGDVSLSKTSDDSAIFFNTSTSLNSITLNAVGGHSVALSAVKEGLRKINLVPPLNNNINMASNEVVKIKSLNGASLTIELVSGTSSQSFVIPTLIA